MALTHERPIRTASFTTEQTPRCTEEFSVSLYTIAVSLW
jgi:hypothetical protein